VKIQTILRELHPRRPFRIARARRTAVLNVFVRITDDGVSGYGEASPNAFYDETAEDVAARLSGCAPHLSSLKIRSVADIEAAWQNLWPLLAPSRAAQCALDLALWDWLARREGASVAQLVWRRAPQPVRTFCTIGISDPEELAEKVEELDGFPKIKIKSGAAADLEPVRYVRARLEAVLAVDANCGWNPAALEALSAELVKLGVAFIEQPFPPGEDRELSRISCRLPVFADESCVVLEDVERMAGSFHGFNIKLVKCGGLTPALRMLRRGRELGLQTMVGCMLESSALIAAGAVVAQGTDHADLDGAWLLGDDPFRGWEFSRGLLTPPAQSGLGITPDAALFGTSREDG
jgi:L-alanine-DL-glutamate epimerase-like enolase superfamily enzyme